VSSSADETAEIKVGAHVLVQLGSELVTDVEQAILECVKNAYDADAPGCLIEIDTREVGTLIERGSAEKLRAFDQPFETVKVELLDEAGQLLSPATQVSADSKVQRKLTYTGRITIEDKGDGLSPEQLRTSWLVISRSSKRGAVGAKKVKTAKGRTPLGDKGLGRLGSMKLGDILRIETATAATKRIAVAQFRWADCESAKTVDEIPVFLEELPNDMQFKGTRVSVLGLRDLPEWRRKDRINEITRSLARLISPFEATSTFPVGVKLDGVDHSLVTVTEEVLKRAIADFHFKWERDPTNLQKHVLVAEARFKKRLFMSTRGDKAKERTVLVFDKDGGAGFASSLQNFGRLKPYKDKQIDLDGSWFITLKRTFQWSDMQLDSGAAIIDPGSFAGAFYFFHLDDKGDPDQAAAAGLGLDRNLIRGMTGISILRDGFRVRSQGDWLELSAGMTSGSTYGMRVDNTVGYFALTGEENHRLVEKSDREGFVEDATYRGFLQIARHCRNFANETLEQVRRALDDYYKKQVGPEVAGVSPTVKGSFRQIEASFQSTEAARNDAARIAGELQKQIEELEQEAGQLPAGGSAAKALQLANNAVLAMNVVRSKLTEGAQSGANLIRLRQEFEERDEQMVALFESAAVGLSARGLAHEMRTHLSEIRQRTAAIDKITAGVDKGLLPHLRAIRASCTAISSAASLIDPMLPRSRAIKETIVLRDFVEEYFKTRAHSLDRAGIKTRITGTSATVRANRPRLLQVFDNLVRNSSYWLRRSEVTGQVIGEKEILVEFIASGFVLSDNGPGVDPHYEEILFDIFVTAKPERDSGQGLGLFITTELLRIDGCEVTLLPDRNDRGNRFKFSVNLRSLIVGV
jgi:signal transduction histidine kinase